MSTKRPNILLVVADCARADRWVGPGRTTVTPNLDRLCAEGVTLPTAITEKSCTTPSFSTLLTGLYSPRHGVHLVFGYRLPEQVPMLTEKLAEEGYHTYAEVSGPLLPELGLARGFEQYEYRAPCDYLHTAWGDQFVERLRTGYYRSPWFILLHTWELHVPRQVLPEYDAPAYGQEEYERTVSSLDAQLGRVFAGAGDDTLIAFTGDHGEKLTCERFAEGGAIDYARELLGIRDDDGEDGRSEGLPLYQVGMIAGPSVLQQVYTQLTPMVQDINLRAWRNKPRPTRWARFRDRLRMLRLAPWLSPRDLFALRSPLKLTRMLKQRGLLDETQARAKLEHYAETIGREHMIDMHLRMWVNTYRNNVRKGHGVHVYDSLVRVPFVLRWPQRLPAGVVRDRMVRQPDFMPTILDLVGVDGQLDAEIDGRSFAPLISGRAWEPLPAYLSLTGVPADIELRGVRTEQYKYTFGPRNPRLPRELYDLSSDPAEFRNLAEERPDLCAELGQLANSFVPDGSEGPAELMAVDPGQQEKVEQHLRSLGYIE